MQSNILSPYVKGFKSMCCDNIFSIEEIEYVCPYHSQGTLDVIYDYDEIKEQYKNFYSSLNNTFRDIWKYSPLLPIKYNCKKPNLLIGNTPLYKANKLELYLGIKNIFIKDEGRNHTGSLKDRASALAVVLANAQNFKYISTASTGNAGSALAGICAATDLQAVIFLPKNAPKAKLAQMLNYGAKIIQIDGSYDDCIDISLEVAKRKNWYIRNTGYNPFMTEGKKTVIFEIVEEIGNLPIDVLIVSVGDGSIIGSIYKGLYDLFNLGWIDKMPRIFGVQAEGSNYLYRSFENSSESVAISEANTIADSLAVKLPRDKEKAIRAVSMTNGQFICVNDEQILESIHILAKLTGIFGEPASAATLAGLIKAKSLNLIDQEENVVIISTGNGLKDVESAILKPERFNNSIVNFDNNAELILEKLVRNSIFE